MNAKCFLVLFFCGMRGGLPVCLSVNAWAATATLVP